MLVLELCTKRWYKSERFQKPENQQTLPLGTRLLSWSESVTILRSFYCAFKSIYSFQNTNFLKSWIDQLETNKYFHQHVIPYVQPNTHFTQTVIIIIIIVMIIIDSSSPSRACASNMQLAKKNCMMLNRSPWSKLTQSKHTSVQSMQLTQHSSHSTTHKLTGLNQMKSVELKTKIECR